MRPVWGNLRINPASLRYAAASWDRCRSTGNGGPKDKSYIIKGQKGPKGRKGPIGPRHGGDGLRGREWTKWTGKADHEFARIDANFLMGCGHGPDDTDCHSRHCVGCPDRAGWLVGFGVAICTAGRAGNGIGYGIHGGWAMRIAIIVSKIMGWPGGGRAIEWEVHFWSGRETRQD